MNPSHPKKSLNPWPYAVIGFFVVFISLIVIFIVFSLGQEIQLVRPDYYEEEIRGRRRACR